MKRAVLLLLALPLAACWGGVSDEFTAAECDAFAAQYYTLGGISAALGEEGKGEVRDRAARECRERTLGLSRKEYACAMKAGSRAEWTACGIVLKG